MEDEIYLVVDRIGVRRMTKSMPQLTRGQIPVKLKIAVNDSAFREPVIEKKVVIEDWREGIDIADVDFKETFITDDEAAMIRQQRLDKMHEILQAQGYQISKPDDLDDGE